MKLSTGKISIPIEFDNGDVEYICFNPNDPELIDRISNFSDGVKKRIDQIDIEKYKDEIENNLNIEINSIDDFENLTEEEKESVRKKTKAFMDLETEYQQKICDELDDIFEDSISTKVFKYVKPLVYVERYDKKGEYEPYMMQFLRALEFEIKKYSNKTSEAMKKHIDKYNKK